MAPTLFQKLFSKRGGSGAPGRDTRDPDGAFSCWAGDLEASEAPPVFIKFLGNSDPF